MASILIRGSDHKFRKSKIRKNKSWQASFFSNDLKKMRKENSQTLSTSFQSLINSFNFKEKGRQLVY